MGHWKQCPHTQGWKDTAWSPLGAHKHLKDHIRRCQHRVSDGLNCGLGVILWYGHHLQQLGSPWGMGAMPPHPRDGRTLLAHLGGAHTHHHNHIRRCRHRIRRYRITVWVRFGCCMVVVHVILSMQGHHGALGARPPYPRDGTALLGHLRGATHTLYSTVGSNCAASFGCRTVACTSSSAARAAMGHCPT